LIFVRFIGDGRMVAGGSALLRRAEAAADLDVLAAGVEYLPPSDSGADLAAAGRATRAGHLRAIGGRDVGGGRPDVFRGLPS
jgi:hypothetical protein